MDRQKARTIDTATALETLNDPNRPGAPLGNLASLETGWPRNDLPFDGSAVEDTDEDRLASILAEVGQGGGEGFVSIWKVSEQSKKLEYVDRRDTGEFEANGLPYLSKQFGAGDYELRIYGSNKRLVARPRVTISKAAAQAHHGALSHGTGADMAGLVAVMSEGFQQLGNLIVKAQSQSQPGNSRTDILNELRTMKEIFGGNAQSNPVEMFTQLATVFKSMQPREPGEGSAFLDLIDRFSPIIMDAVKNQQSLPAPAVLPATVPAASAGNPQPAQAAQSQLTPEQRGAKEMSFQLKMQLTYLCAQANRDSDPGPFAEIIADQIDEQILTGLVNDPNWLEALSKFHPGVKQFPEWFDELRTLVMEAMKPEDLPTEDNDVINARNSPGNSEDVLE
jgi:hypothetical protein